MRTKGGMNKSFSYDGNGDLISVTNGAQTANINLNAAGQITSITPPGGSAITMSYTGVGEQERVAAGSMSYQYDASELSQQSAGTTSTNFTSLPDGTLISETAGSSTYYYLSDGAGSTAGLTDQSGTLQNTYAYDPLGNVTASSGTVSNPFTFHGWSMDSATGYYYTGSGYYDPQTGQSFGCQDKGMARSGGRSLRRRRGFERISCQQTHPLQPRVTCKRSVAWVDKLSRI